MYSNWRAFGREDCGWIEIDVVDRNRGAFYFGCDHFGCMAAAGAAHSS